MGDSDVTTLTPIRIAAIYVGAGVVWVLASDYILAETIATRNLEGTVQTLKSVGFVFASGLLIFALSRRGQHQVRDRVQRLQESTDAIESLVDVSPQPVVHLDLDGRIRRWNDGATELFGWDESEVVGEQLPFVPDANREQFEQHLDRVAAGETIRNKEIVRQRKDGSEVALSLSAAPVRDHDGSVTSVMAVLVDIQEYKAREALLESLLTAGERIMNATAAEGVCGETIETTTAVIDIPFAGVWLADEDAERLRPASLSDSALTRFGDQSSVEPSENSVWTAFESNELQELEQALDDRPVFDADAVLGAGVAVPIPGHGVLVAASEQEADLDETDRRLLQLLGSFTEAALDRVDREQALANERQFIDTALDALWDIFVVIDADTGTFVRWNERLEEISTYDESSLGDASLADIIRDEDVDATVEAVSNAVETGASAVEVGITTPDGEVVQHEFRGRRLDLPSRDRPVVVAIGRDISEQRRLERALRENERRYRTLVEMSPLPIVVHADTEVAFANEAFRDLVDADVDSSLVGRPLTEFVRSEEVSTVEETARATQEGRVTPTKKRYHVESGGGGVRHVETTSRPIAYEGRAAVLTIVEDITDRVRHEERLRTLHAITRELMGAESVLETMTEAAQAGSTLLELPDAVVFRYDESAGQLVPAIAAEGSEEYITELGSVDRGEYTPVWDAFVTGEPKRFSGKSDALPFEDGVLLPLKMYGVLVVGSTESAPVDDQTMELAEILRRNLESTLDRLDREATLQERDRELARRNEELEQLTQLDGIIRSVNQALITATTREDIEGAVCTNLADAAAFSGVWIGERTRSTTPVTPVTGEGFDLDAVEPGETSDDDPIQALTATAMESGEVVVAEDIVEDPAWASRRRHALDTGYRVVAAVPIPIHGDVERVLVLHSGEPDLFTDRSTEVFEELGKIIGNALETVGGRHSIHAEEYTRITVDIDDSDWLFGRLVDETGGRFTLRGAIPTEDAVQLFLTSSVSPARVEAAVDSVPGVTYLQPADPEDTDDTDSVIVLQASIPVFDEVAALGGSVRDLEAGADEIVMTVDVPTGVQVRDVVDAITSVVDRVELLTREEQVTTVQPPETTFAALEAACTERQLEALRAAYYGGYYEWPREATNESLAATLGISSATYQSHRRTAERKLVETVFE